MSSSSSGGRKSKDSSDANISTNNVCNDKLTFIIVYEMKKIFKFLQFGQIIQRGLNLNFHIPIKKKNLG